MAVHAASSAGRALVVRELTQTVGLAVIIDDAGMQRLVTTDGKLVDGVTSLTTRDVANDVGTISVEAIRCKA